ncbi:hypothetical protein GCM10027168_51730 [Streptomyces capparidis]
MTASQTTPVSPPGLLRAYGLCALALLAAFCWLGAALGNLDTPWMGDWFPWGARNLLLGCALAVSGAFLVARRAARSLGWLLLGSGCALNLAEAVSLTAALAGVPQGPYTLLFCAVLALRAPYVAVMLALPLWLPDGRLPRRWGRWAVAAVAAWCALLVLHDGLLWGEHYGVPIVLPEWAGAGLTEALGPDLDLPMLAVTPTLPVAALAVMAVRWRRSPGRHGGLAVLLTPYLLWMAMVFSAPHLPLSPVATEVVYHVGTAIWPLAVVQGFARDRTWYLDRTDRRVLTGFLLTYGLATVYGGAILALSLLVPGALTPGALSMAALALVVGALARPTGRWAARMVDRYYYGERAHPYQVVRELVDRLGRAGDPFDAPRLVCATVVHTLGLPGACLVVDTRSGPRELARLGDVRRPCEDHSLTYRGEVIGRLTVPARPGEHALDRQDRAAVRDLADHAAPAIASLRLYQDLRSSREQIVLAREEERRHLRHDLHDGLGPALSGLRLQADAVRSCLPPDGAGARAMQAVSEGIGQAITELRHITEGLAPAALSRAGLTAALRQLADRMAGPSLSVATAFRPDPLPPFPAAVEVAVYRIAAEALNNVVRHSRAERAVLEVRVEGGAVTVEVRDDGHGFPVHREGPGLGLRSMAERAEELGGAFAVSSAADGTRVSASLPGTVVEGERAARREACPGG